MSEDKRPTPKDALRFAETAEWVLLAESNQHRLYRTHGGKWITVPVADEEYSRLFSRHFAEAVASGLDALLDDARKMMSKGKSFKYAGLALVSLGLLFMLWGIFGSKPEPATPEERRLILGLSLLALVLCPIAVWFGRKVLGPRLFRLSESKDNPFKAPDSER